MSKNEHSFSPVRKPLGNYEVPEGNNAFDKWDMKGVETTEERLPTSLFLFECPICKAHLYADSRYQKWIVQVEAYAAAIGFKSLQILGLACEPCNAVMEVHPLNEEQYHESTQTH
jgi:hypothetical protein